MKTEETMLLDKYLPKYDFTEVHTIEIKSTAEVAYEAMQDTTMKEIHWFVNVLFNLRALPEKLAGRKENPLSSAAFPDNKSLLDQMLNSTFVKIEEQPPREIVFGLIVPSSIGRVWKKSSGQILKMADAAELTAFNNPDFLDVIANFTIKDESESGCVIVRTESRVKGLSEKARKNFRPYWLIIRPWSGLIRRLWLKAIKRRAERIMNGRRQ
jgi:hypothetical protein